MHRLSSLATFALLGLVSLGLLGFTPQQSQAFTYYGPYGAYHYPYYWGNVYSPYALYGGHAYGEDVDGDYDNYPSPYDYSDYRDFPYASWYTRPNNYWYHNYPWGGYYD